MTTKRTILTLAACTLLWSSPAFADTAGTAGRLAGLVHNDDSSDDYGLVNGRLVVDEGGGTLRTYAWGGSLCPAYVLSNDQLEFLARAMQAKWFVVPNFKTGNAATRCLVGFGLAAKASFTDDVTN